MKKQLLKTLLASVMALIATSAWADEVTATLTHTASSSCAGDGAATAYTSTVDAEKEHVNNAAFDGKTAWQGAAYADFSFTIPEGSVVTKATLTYHIYGESRRDRDCGIYYANAGVQLDYEALAAGNAMVNLPATQIGTVTFNKSGENVEKTQDVSDAIKAIVAAGQGNIIFKWTGNPGGGDVVGKGSESAPTLVIEVASAELQTKFTVKFVDESGSPIKEDAIYDGLIGDQVEAPAEDKANFYTEDGSKKYIFVSSSDAITLVKDEASNVITLTFREAAIFGYTVVFACDELVLGSKTGAGFEGDEAVVSYPKYLAYEDGQLYTKDATNKEYNFKFTPAANAEIDTLKYAAIDSVKNVVFLTEGEDVEDLIPCTSANTGVRSSNSASAYAANDTKIAVLTPGTYKLHAITYDASKEPNSHFIFMAGENQIADFNCTVINIQEFDSEEFTVEQTCDLILKAVGSASIGLDALYITGDGKATAFENTYTLVGNCTAIFGTEWDVNNSDNDLEKIEDGLYTKTYKGVQLQNGYDIQYKVVKNNAYENGEWPYGEGNNANYTVYEGDGYYDVTFTFDLAKNDVSCDMVKGEKGKTFDFQNNNGGWPIGDSSDYTRGELTEENPITMDGITLTGIQGTASNPVRYMNNTSKGNYLQIFKNNSIKLTAPEGKSIVKVEVTMQTGKFDLTPSTGELANNVWTGKATEVTFADETGTRYVWAIDVTVEDGVPVEEAVYTVAGTEDLTGYNWDKTQNAMTLNAESGLYEWTAENIAVSATAKPEFKIVKNAAKDDETWYPEGDNWVINTDVTGGEGIFTITITFNPETTEIGVSAEKTGGVIYEPAFADGTYYLMNASTGKLVAANGLDKLGAPLAFAFVENAGYTVTGSELFAGKQWVAEGEGYYTFSTVIDGVKKYAAVDAAENFTLIEDSTATSAIWILLTQEYWENEALSYNIAGTADLCGAEWDTTKNPMTKNTETGLYVWTAENITVTNDVKPEFKVAVNNVADKDAVETVAWYPADGNWVITPDYLGGEGSYNITITFDVATKAIGVTGDKIEYALGDASGDGQVTTSDAVVAVDFALEKSEPTPAQFKAADVNNSNDLTVSDAVGIVNIALEIDKQPEAAGARMDNGINYLTLNGQTLSLTNTVSFAGFQMDVTLADGAQLNGVQLAERAAGLKVAINRISDNTWRIIAFSLQNNVISGNDGALLKLNIVGNSNINVTNIEFADAAARAYKLGFGGEATGISSVNGINADAEVYNMNGVRTNTMHKGMNIIRNANGEVKKVLVK